METNNKRIAKNTMFLYFRMLFTMGVSLYTSRVVLSTLGVIDFGIYNVVGGVVAMFGFLNSTLASGTQRFLTFQLGKNDFPELKKTFSAALNTHIILAVIILILAETIGLWFLKNKIVVSVGREYAALWVYQFSVFAAVLSIIQVPYNASIIAHERMNVYAYVSIIDVSLKLLIVYLLVISGYDKLITYSILIFVVTVIVMGIYWVYCKKQYNECRFELVSDKPLYKSMLTFSGWNVFGNAAWMTMGQGVNILLNIFFGPSINASRGIAFQVSTAVSSFVSNFRTAVNPQIIKSYAIGDIFYMNKLVLESAKYSYYLLLLLSLPALLETSILLGIWLKIVPDYAVLFCQLVLINMLIQSFDASFGIIFQAMGRIKENQLMAGFAYLLVLPISYIYFKYGYPPDTAFYIQIIATIFVAFVVKLFLLVKITSISFMDYLKQLLFPVVKVSVVAIIVPVIFKMNVEESIFRFMCVSLISVFSVILSVYFLGMDKNTQMKLLNYIGTRIRFYKSRK